MLVFLLLLIVHFNVCTGGIQVLEDWVLPTVAYPGDTVDLRCNYLVQDETVHSVKWYKDNMEFFRYVPNESPSITVFVQNGTKTSEISTPTHIVLESVTPASSGSYKCEVSGGPPRYTTAARSTNLRVVELPRTPPQILGGRRAYKQGEKLNITCESGMGSPPPELKFFVQSREVELSSQKLETFFPIRGQLRGISRQNLGFIVDSTPNSRLEIVCQAKILDVYADSAMLSIEVLEGGSRSRSFNNKLLFVFWFICYSTFFY
ncbi:uncharacterized protein LOC111696475 [Eurytemora carolleeae]|uniref:uncharacterized protein LOC111696475 n=1 Tax=Eurytemora carolleeae TaxID=1294199 RepID=UPI000C77EBA7|nr:uncharacterized protein LOC111696475 [Eurytemora carolleeae]|eukprot:XP_023321851.1 uncharacterized protein LOC111696475 [Eurytemora affinis]